MPLKRNPALQDYSREHHDELLFGWKIKKGLKANIALQRIVDYCNFHLHEVTLPHMEKEETYILSKLPDNDKGKIKILAEHVTMRKLAKQLQQNYSDKHKLLAQLAEDLEKHVRYEEREFFPEVQNRFDEKILKQMQPSEEKATECAIWSDKFWE